MSDEPIQSEFCDDPDMQELIREYVGELPALCARLAAAADAGDAAALERLGHQLKGSGGGYGFPQLSERGAKLESAARRAGVVNDSVRDCVTAIASICGRLRAP